MQHRADYSFLKPGKKPPEMEAPLKVAIAPTPQFTLMSLAGFVEFLRLSADESDFSRQIYCSWDLLSHNLDPIIASCGFPVTPGKCFDDPAGYDYVVVHGGILHGKSPCPQELRRFVRAAVAAEVPVVGLCTGQFILAELGLLNGKRCAVHFSLAAAMKHNFPEVVPVTNRPVVEDGQFITCPGGLASINLAMHLVDKNCGRSRTHKTLHYLMADRGFDEMRAVKDQDDIDLLCLNKHVANAVGLMRQKMFETCTIAEIAGDIGITERELTRLFRKYLRIPPGEYWRRLRLKAAHWMVLNSKRSITQIAYECGFTDSSHMIHWFKQVYNQTPGKLRKLHMDFGVH